MNLWAGLLYSGPDLEMCTCKKIISFAALKVTFKIPPCWGNHGIYVTFDCSLNTLKHTSMLHHSVMLTPWKNSWTGTGVSGTERFSTGGVGQEKIFQAVCFVHKETPLLTVINLQKKNNDLSSVSIHRLLIKPKCLAIIIII